MAGPDHSRGEERLFVLGMSSRRRVLVVIHADHAEGLPKARLICPRSATRHERGQYENTR